MHIAMRSHSMVPVIIMFGSLYATQYMPGGKQLHFWCQLVHGVSEYLGDENEYMYLVANEI